MLLVILWSAAAALLLWHASRYWPFIADDALISLRYAKRLVLSHGLTWNDGERVEGYSNLLWILICAGFGRLGVDLIAAARALGIVSSLATLGAIAISRRPTSLRSSVPASIGLAIFAVPGCTAIWTIGGLEQPLMTALFVWAAVLVCFTLDDPQPARRVWVAGILLGLVCLTRPDGPVLCGGLMIGFVLAVGVTRRSWAIVFSLAAPCLVAVVGQTLFRRAYYGDWVPNTAYAKVALTKGRIEFGFHYVTGSLRPLAGIYFFAAVAFIAAFLRGSAVRKRVLLIGIPLLLWLAYVALVGGDFFPAYRQLVVAIALCALLAVEGMTALRLRGLRTEIVALAIAVGAIADLFVQQARDPENTRAADEHWEWDGERVGHFLKDTFGKDAPLLAVDAAGCLPYFSDLPAVDMLGLNDRYLARHRPTDFGMGPLGHELGNGQYVLSQHPDLVIFCLPGGGDVDCFRSGHELRRHPSFQTQYRLINFVTTPPRSTETRIWVRMDGRVGIHRDGQGIRIPGFLFASWRGVFAHFLDGRLVADIPIGQIAAVRGLYVPRGRWRIELEGEVAEAGIRVRIPPSGNMLEGNGQLEFDHGGGEIELEVLSRADGAKVAAAMLTPLRR